MQDLKTKKQIFKRSWIYWDLENVAPYIFYIAEQMCRFTRAEFLQGCRALKADNIKSVQQRLPEAAAEALARSDLFKDLYRYTFRFGLASTSCATRYSEGEYLISYNFQIQKRIVSAETIRFWQMHFS